MNSRLIVVSGPDGAGKTALLECLGPVVESRGYAVKYTWRRLIRYSSLPAYLVARTLGCKQTVTIRNHVHHFYSFRSFPRLGSLIVWLQALDVLIAWLHLRLMVSRNGAVVLCDRFALDILCDLIAATGNPEIADSYPGRLLSAISKRSETIVVTAARDKLRARRPEVEGDPFFEIRLDAYIWLANRSQLPVVENDGLLMHAASKILESVRLDLIHDS